MPKTNFFGYVTLEFLRDVLATERPVYASAMQVPGKPDKYRMYSCRADIIIEQPDDRGDVHYCLIPIGRYMVMAGVPDFEEQRKAQVLARQEKVFSLVERWLREAGFAVREARIDRPNNLQMLEGYFENLRYDAVNDTFSVSERQSS